MLSCTLSTEDPAMETQLPLFAAELPASAQHTIRKAITLLERQSREPGVPFTSRHDVRDWLLLQAPS
ncbi:hypothetical protein H0I54_04935 [Yersinia kristensenii]|uniref:hypothetical protein n=2 Tax=Enterobacterales TaxID=91347 RepID=UPI001C6094BC|nr:hypothetical protein [Yersinia kristensenii]MBW5841156.1 hypothetical protein [Yersinia kristensenii]